MENISVNAQNSYNIILSRDSQELVPEYLTRNFSYKKICIITDSNVAHLHAEKLIKNLQKSGFTVCLLVVPSGEGSKSLSQAEKIYLGLSQNFISRSDLIIALGGGVVGDIAGFVASTYLRGVNFINIPTSLLAQVDSSVGGKTGVNLSSGKNLVGTFYTPKAVFIDPTFLATLPKKELCCGIAEVIKCAVIKSPLLFEKLSCHRGDILGANFIDEVISKCIKIKKDLVQKDEFDKNERMLLNFGHTLGHAIEKYYGYSKFSHGQAISLGMLEMIKAGEKLNYTAPSCYKKVFDLLNKYNLPTEFDIPFDKLADSILLDKKNINEKISLVLIKNIGDCFIKQFSINEVKNIFKEETK